jgi:hypothetical protein
MSEIGEDFKFLKEQSKKKKKKNLKNSLAILEKKKIPYEQLNPHHFRVDGKFDFWPSTGKFYNMRIKKYGRGVFNLIKYLKEEPK